MNKNRNILIVLEKRLMVAKGEEHWGWVKKVKGLRNKIGSYRIVMGMQSAA